MNRPLCHHFSFVDFFRGGDSVNCQNVTFPPVAFGRASPLALLLHYSRLSLSSNRTKTSHMSPSPTLIKVVLQSPCDLRDYYSISTALRPFISLEGLIETISWTMVCCILKSPQLFWFSALANCSSCPIFMQASPALWYQMARIEEKELVETVQRSWSYFSVHISTSREKWILPAMSGMWGAQWKGEVKDDCFFPHEVLITL